MCVWHCGVKDPDFSINDAKTSRSHTEVKESLMYTLVNVPYLPFCMMSQKKLTVQQLLGSSSPNQSSQSQSPNYSPE